MNIELRFMDNFVLQIALRAQIKEMKERASKQREWAREAAADNDLDMYECWASMNNTTVRDVLTLLSIYDQLEDYWR